MKKELERLGFELYEVGRPAVLVYYVEAETVKELEEKIKAAEALDGVIKAYIVYGFLAGNEVREWINKSLESGELELDNTTREYIKWILKRLGISVESDSGI